MVPDRTVLKPVDGISYHAFVDPSGGGPDAFTMGISHYDEATGMAVLDCLVERMGTGPALIVAEYAKLAKTYLLRRRRWRRERGSTVTSRFIPTILHG